MLLYCTIMLRLATYVRGYSFLAVQLHRLLLCMSLNSLKERQQQRGPSNAPNKRETRWALNVTWNKEERSATGMNASTELAESFCRVAVFTWSRTDLPDYHLTSGLHAANTAAQAAIRPGTRQDVWLKITATIRWPRWRWNWMCLSWPIIWPENMCVMAYQAWFPFRGRSARSHSDVFSIPTTTT